MDQPEIGSMIHGETQGVLTQLRAYLGNKGRLHGARLPPERQLAHELGVSRGSLRKALADLEAEGRIWRHVGRGTFIGDRPVATVQDLSDVVRRTNPAGVMEARLALEPELARLAALHATRADLDELAACMSAARAAEDWRAYEYNDNRLHRAIAQATANIVLLALFDSLNTVRRTVTWGRQRRSPQRPDPDHHSFVEHERIVDAIAHREAAQAAEAMRAHLLTVRSKLLLAMVGSERVEALLA
jgi:DNA-binding FadR family transcriptional regulator